MSEKTDKRKPRGKFRIKTKVKIRPPRAKRSMTFKEIKEDHDRVSEGGKSVIGSAGINVFKGFPRVHLIVKDVFQEDNAALFFTIKSPKTRRGNYSIQRKVLAYKLYDKLYEAFGSLIDDFSFSFCQGIKFLPGNVIYVEIDPPDDWKPIRYKLHRLERRAPRPPKEDHTAKAVFVSPEQLQDDLRAESYVHGDQEADRGFSWNDDETARETEAEQVSAPAQGEDDGEANTFDPVAALRRIQQRVFGSE